MNIGNSSSSPPPLAPTMVAAMLAPSSSINSNDAPTYGSNDAVISPYSSTSASAPAVSASPSPSSASRSSPPSETDEAAEVCEHLVRTTSEIHPWDEDAREGGGVATYLPAPPSPPSQQKHVPTRARSKTHQVSRTMGVNSLGPAHGGWSQNSSRVGAPASSMEASLLSHIHAPPSRDEIHSDNLSATYVASSSSQNGVRLDGEEEVNDEQVGDEEDDDTEGGVPDYHPPAVNHSHKLGQWMATGICGNDITSSCLYVTGLCVADAGIFAPVCLLMVAGTLWLFRKVYGEAVTALPLNGGAYNVLLNTTTKSTAAVAACLTILSYVATAVVSGSEAIDYLHKLSGDIPVEVGTIVLLSIFAFLNLMGITDSARVAFTIFSMHIATMTLLAGTVIVYVCQHGFHQFRANYYYEHQPTFTSSILFGFSSAMLGVSGFESSANFVEEQKEFVFVKTLRNMWVCVSIFNPLLAFLALCVMPQEEIANPVNQSTVLAEMGRIASGDWLKDLVCADAFLVLSGGVLTSFVGVTGLCRRLALDRCLPQFLLAENRWRHTNHWIILGFLGVCSSMYLILKGEIYSLANVYSVSFLSVMGLFAIGNMLLKYKRGKLKREVTAAWGQVILALFMVTLALVGLLAKDASILVVWCLYFFVTAGLVATMFFRMQTLKILHRVLKGIFGKRIPRCLETIETTIKNIAGQSIGFFAKSGKLSVLNKAVLYVRANEDCAWIRIIHVYESEDRIPAKLLRNVNVLDEAYPKIKIDLVLVPGTFSPDVIDYLSTQLHIPKNLMFITCPTENFAHKIETLGGVRLITH